MFHCSLPILSNLADLDECALGLHNCSDGCSNTRGGHHCNCPKGYRVQPFGSFCEGRQHADIILHIVSCSVKYACFSTGLDSVTPMRYHYSLYQHSPQMTIACYVYWNVQYVSTSLSASVMFCGFWFCTSSCTYWLYHADVDECLEGTHNCSAECMNTPGGFLCGCTSGYLLSEDGVSCNGTYVILL